jgi:hypothetical protein
MIHISIQLQTNDGDASRKTSVLEKVYDPMTGYLDLLRDYEALLKGFYRVEEKTEDADAAGS